VIVSTARSQEARLRVALIGLTRPSTADSTAIANKAESVLNTSLGSDSRVSLVDESIARSALKGIGYDGSINMSRDEARRVGSAIGCDFFLTGKLEAFTRSDRAAEEHEEALLGVMVVDGRTGELAVFDFIAEKGATRQAAVDALMKTLATRAAGYIDRMSRFQLARAQIGLPSTDKTPAERVEDIPDEASPAAAGFKPPEFINRVKPDYPDAADRADITATVEASAVFRANGEVGEVQITRWAGFSLDESAERAIRQLKFKPATRDAKPISVRATVRYNFRRSSEPPAQTPTKPDDKPVPDLRRLFKPRPPASFQ
ncbi:MAG TPA: energy transducer TonB, partial [Blastocatellia bacterium]|nr:energy transducer TonB [Blastocatellia bacterium]